MGNERRLGFSVPPQDGRDNAKNKIIVITSTEKLKKELDKAIKETGGKGSARAEYDRTCLEQIKLSESEALDALRYLEDIARILLPEDEEEKPKKRKMGF